MNNRLAGRRAARNVRALCRAGGEPVREDHRPHRDPARTSTNIRSCRIAAGTSISSRISLLDVYAHFPGGQRQGAGAPALFRAGRERDSESRALVYTVRRLPRRRTVEEKRYGASSDYTGTDMFISFGEPARQSKDDDSVAELSVRALCSNRHLTEHLPVGEGGADFRLLDDVTLDVICIRGPTPPREPVVGQLRSRSETAHTGTVTWRLINMLSLNHLGLVERGGGQNAAVAARNAVAVRRPVGQRDRTQDPRRAQRRQPGGGAARAQRTGSGIARGIEIM